MAQDKVIEQYSSYFFLGSVVLLGIDVITIGNLSLHNMGVDIFTKVTNRILKTGFYAKNYYYMRILIVAFLCFATFGGKPKKKIKEENKAFIIIQAIIVSVVFIFSYLIFYMGSNGISFSLYCVTSVVLFAYLISLYSKIAKMIKSSFMDDRFGVEGRKFEQTKELIENEDSINLKTDDGYINIVNPYRATAILGTPGSGKSFAILIPALIQLIRKGFSIYLYDYKFYSLTIVAYNALRKYFKNYKVKPLFCVINFDDPRYSNRCNPLQPDLLISSTDAVQSAKSIMFALNRQWIQKEGDFFVESPINFVACLIWGLKVSNNGKYCSLPHLIELISMDYDDQFNFLRSIEDQTISNMLAPFISAQEKGAAEQLEGQIASARIGLSRLTSQEVYWIMTTNTTEIINEETGEVTFESDGVSLDINNPKEPKIFCIGNNPDRQDVYGICISLYNTRILRLINKKDKNPTGVFLDELPTLSFAKGTLDNVIATGRSNRIAVIVGFQDLAQMIRDFGRETADAIINTFGNIFSGSVNFETAEKLSRMFGKIKVQKESKSVSDSGTSISYSEQMEDLIPASEINTLSQGTFVGKVSDNFGQKIDQKFFNSNIHVDMSEMKELEAGELPIITEFRDASGNFLNEQQLNQVMLENFKKVKAEVKDLIKVANAKLEMQDL
ncbi:conjugal transfer protein TraG [Elizabethkingia anophelis]|nr:conjugal transfer protein TraG [Elizabethkingia anophelis]